MNHKRPIERAAQTLLESPGAAAEIVDGFDAELRSHFGRSGMLDHQPAKAEYLIARQKRKLVWSSLWHAATDQVICSLLPNIRETGELPRPTESVSGNPFYTFIETMETMFARGSAQATGTPAHPHDHYRALWNQAKHTQDAYGSTWQDLRNHYTAIDSQIFLRPPTRPLSSEHMGAIWEGAARNIAVTSLWLITNLRHATDKQDAGHLFQYAEMLNWGTSMNRAINLELFPDLFTPLPENLDNDFFTKHKKLFIPTEHTGGVSWAHSSLRSGPWKSPGGCAGEVWLLPPSQTARENAEEFFRRATERFDSTAPSDTKQGRYNSGLAAIVIGGFVAEQTIYRADPI